MLTTTIVGDVVVIHSMGHEKYEGTDSVFSPKGQEKYDFDGVFRPSGQAQEKYVGTDGEGSPNGQWKYNLDGVFRPTGQAQEKMGRTIIF